MHGLSRRNPEYDVDTIVTEIEGMLDGPDCIAGYRHVWHSLQLKGYQVLRQVVELLLRELDPDGCQLRKRHTMNGKDVSIITQVQMPSGTPMDMTNLNPIVFQFMVALTAGVKNCYGW